MTLPKNDPAQRLVPNAEARLTVEQVPAAAPAGEMAPKTAAAPAVLVLDADSRAGLACVQSLGFAGAIVHAGLRSEDAVTRHSRWCREIHAQPEFEPIPAALDWLLQLDAGHDFQLIVASTEGSLRWLRALPPQHPARGKAPMPGDEAIDIALDKARTTQLAQSLGLPVPASLHIEQGTKNWPQPLGFPSVIKPVRSKVVINGALKSLSVEIVRNTAQRDAVFSSWLPYVDVQEQQWVPGRGIGVEMLFEHGRLVWSFVHERLHELPLSGGASTLRRSVAPEPRLINWSQQLMEALHWHGVAMVEWRRGPGGDYHLMEINPRLWGSLPLTIASGLNVPVHLWELAQGKSVRAPQGYKSGVTARNPREDLRWMFANWKAEKSDPMLLTCPPMAAAAGWLQALMGREHWDGWRLDDWLVLVRESWELASVVPRKFMLRLIDHVDSVFWKRHHAGLLRQLRRRQVKIHRVLFLCYGNICRSAFAERAAGTLWPAMAVESAGFHAKTGRTSPVQAVEVAKSLGIDLCNWSSREITAEQIDAAELIILMDRDNLQLLRDRFPQALHKTTFLGLFNRDGSMEIADPYNLNLAGMRNVFKDILRAMVALAEQDFMHH